MIKQVAMDMNANQDTAIASAYATLMSVLALFPIHIHQSSVKREVASLWQLVSVMV